MSASKVFATPRAALAGLLRDDMTIMSGGFGGCGIPVVLIDEILESGVGMAPGTSLEEVRAGTAAPFALAPGLN